jgi:hypothetical protein
MKTQFCIVGMMGWLLKCLPAMAADNAIPPFVAEGRLVTEQFRPDTNLNHRTEGSVAFHYSNGWWQVESRHRYMHRPSEGPFVENSMKIPDGTRSYTLFEGSTNRGMTMALACPISFPLSGRTAMLDTWLGLCPYPELPLIDGQRMRRFITLPDYRPKIFNAPENEGVYAAKYLTPENAFLSELVVKNNGFSIDLNVLKSSAEDEGEIRRYPPPFDNGFTELQYQVIETTNLHGLTFPLRAVCKRFYPNWATKDPVDLYVSMQSELTVTRISFSEKDMANRLAAPAEMVATDERPGARSSYLVSDDQWKPVSDPEIKRRTRSAGQEREKSE